MTEEELYVANYEKAVEATERLYAKLNEFKPNTFTIKYVHSYWNYFRKSDIGSACIGFKNNGCNCSVSFGAYMCPKETPFILRMTDFKNDKKIDMHQSDMDDFDTIVKHIQSFFKGFSLRQEPIYEQMTLF